MSDTPEELTAWTDDLAAALGIPGDIPVADLLTVTRDVAHGVTRPAGPLTTYLIGRAVAQGMPLADAIAIVHTKIEEHA